MSAPVTSKATLTYGALIIGGSTDYQPDGPPSLSASYDTLTLDFPFTCTGGLDGSLDELRAGLRLIASDLSLKWDGKTYTWTKGAGTGFNHRGTLVVPGNEDKDTRKTRHYIARLEVELPADSTDKLGLKNEGWVVTTSRGGRRELVLTGSYTGITAEPSSYANFIANYGTWATAVKAIVDASATWDNPIIVAEPNGEDSLTGFRLVYKEVIQNQAKSTLNHAGIVDPLIRIKRQELGSEGSPLSKAVAPPVVVTASYSAGVARGTKLESAWTSIVRPLLIDALAGYLSTDHVALMEDAPDYTLDDHELGGSMVLRGYFPADKDIVDYRVTVSKGGKPAETLIPYADEDPLTAHLVVGPGVVRITISETMLVIGSFDELFLQGMSDASDRLTVGPHGERPRFGEFKPGGGEGDLLWVADETPSQEATPLRVGMDPHSLDMVQFKSEASFRAYKALPAV